MICPPDHSHGESSNCYIGHKCRCAPCRVARSVEQRMYTHGTCNRCGAETRIKPVMLCRDCVDVLPEEQQEAWA